MEVEAVLRAPSPADRAARELRESERRQAGAGTDLQAAVGEIVEAVRRDGDRAVIELTRRLDTGGDEPWPLRVDPLELADALETLDRPLREALELAASNVRAVALAELGGDREVELPQGQRVRVREIPVRRAAVYVPGGRAPYPSTVVMATVVAQVAGVEQIAVCAPPRATGAAHPEILAACALCGIGEVYRMGGAQAVAALSLGTATIEPVDVLVGPGNPYVQEAKRQLCHRVGIDSFAGPTELLVVLAGPEGARLAALDLLAQAEHGPGTRLLAVSPSPAALEELGTQLRERGPGGPAGPCRLVAVDDLEAALDFADAYAPEHLELIGADAEALAPRVRAAGCVLVGAQSGAAFADYVAGSNHVLPTGGAARYSSALSPHAFRRRMTQVQLDGAAARLAEPGAAIARAEGFAAHAESMEARIHDNGVDG